jgi:hypothetical protein
MGISYLVSMPRDSGTVRHLHQTGIRMVKIVGENDASIGAISSGDNTRGWLEGRKVHRWCLHAMDEIISDLNVRLCPGENARCDFWRFSPQTNSSYFTSHGVCKCSV